MYWGQITVAAASAIGAAWVSLGYDYEVGTSIAVAVVTYVCARWMITWAYRIRYWYGRGTQGVYYEWCPNCEVRRYRMRGDWILRCHSCGWRPGWLGLRWLTRSVPSIQLRRTVVGPQLLVVVVAVLLIVSGLTTGIPIVSQSSSVDGGVLTEEDPSEADVGSISTPQSDSTPQTTTGTDEDHLNTTKTERWVWRYSNIERSQRGLNNVSYAPRIAIPARNHSENMAKHDYIGHTEPNGETGEERYQNVCDYSGSGYTFGENAANAYYQENFIAWGTNKTVYLATEKEVARYLVNQWMRSDGHRENIRHEEWSELGVGVAASDNKVYASQTFC